MKFPSAHPWPQLLLVALLSVALYWPARDFQFIDYDDPTYVSKNPHVARGLDPAGLRWALTATDGGNWNPATWLSHMLDVELFGLRPGGHHLTNVLLHALNAALLLWLLAAMTGARWRSVLVAALFAVHPLHVESVAWVAERKDVLSATFVFLALAAYLRHARRPGAGRLLPSLALFACALASKPMAVTLPFLLLLLDYWPLGRLGPLCSPARDLWRRAAGCVREKAPFLLLSVVVSVVTYHIQDQVGALRSLAQHSLAARFENAAAAYAGYLAKTLWPHSLAVFYPLAGDSPSPATTAAALALLLGVSALAVLGVRRRPFLLVGWCWYLGTLFPVIGLVQVGWQAMADRYTYVPLTGIFLAAVWGLGDAPLPPRLRTPLRVLVSAALLAALALASRHRLEAWRTNETLWSRETTLPRPAPLAFHALAREYLRQAGEERDAARRERLVASAGRAVEEGLQLFEESPVRPATHAPQGAFYRSKLLFVRGRVLEARGAPAEQRLAAFQQALAADANNPGANLAAAGVLFDMALGTAGDEQERLARRSLAHFESYLGVVERDPAELRGARRTLEQNWALRFPFLQPEVAALRARYWGEPR